MSAILGFLHFGTVHASAVHGLLSHHGDCVRTARIADASLTSVGREPGRLFGNEDLLVAFAGHPVLAGKPVRDASDLALAYKAGQLSDMELLNGHFAIAIVDPRMSRTLFLRDTIGVNPLYRTQIEAGLAFCTEYKALRALPGFDRSLDFVSIRGFEQTGWVPAGTTFFSSVKPAAPGKITRIVRVGSAFLVTETAGSDPPDSREHVDPEALAAGLERAVTRSISDQTGEPGVMLSSGVDSAVVATLVAKARTGKSVHAFTVGHKHGDPEIAGAARTADALGLRHHVLLLEAGDLSRWLPDCLWTMENPGGHDEYPCLFALCQRAADHVTVLYSGNLSDTLFGGMQSQIDLWRSVNGLPVDRQARPAPPSILGERTPPEAAQVERPYHSLRDDMIAAMRRRDERFGAQAMLAARFGIDLRMPFSDRNLVDLAFLIPDDQKVGPSGGKLILRQAAALMLPGRIAERPKRVQQLRYDQAMQSWLTKMFDRLLPTDGDRARGIYDRHGLKVMREHLADALTAETFRPAWNALSIEIWMRLFHDEDRFTRIETGQSTPSGEIA